MNLQTVGQMAQYEMRWYEKIMLHVM